MLRRRLAPARNTAATRGVARRKRRMLHERTSAARRSKDRRKCCRKCVSTRGEAGRRPSTIAGIKNSQPLLRAETTNKEPSDNTARRTDTARASAAGIILGSQILGIAPTSQQPNPRPRATKSVYTLNGKSGARSMKKCLLAGAAICGAMCASVGALTTGRALAADLPPVAPPPTVIPVPAYPWSGSYIGVHGGWGFGDVDFRTIDFGILGLGEI